ncbi:hypothetical protein [Bradyrhizobium elkanii]|uniref:hypothetical protein n=1 Tax=Bradyrhizobium elkanii TaxID=29448 RepID=UPI000570CAE9|nr:hypothetical protein [Bradyrhizobium elkanii]
MHVPWGFVFRGDFDSLPTVSATLDDFKDFWTSIFDINIADSDDLARVYRFDVAQDSEMISPTIPI